MPGPTSEPHPASTTTVVTSAATLIPGPNRRALSTTSPCCTARHLPSGLSTVTAQRERIIRVEQWWDSGSDFTFLLLDAAQTRMLGHFGLHSRIGPNAIEMGYWLTPDATGHGYATSAAGALTKAALEHLGVARIEIHCDAANIPSQRIPQRLDYRLDRVEDEEIEAPAEVGRSMIWIFPPSQ